MLLTSSIVDQTGWSGPPQHQPQRSWAMMMMVDVVVRCRRRLRNVFKLYDWQVSCFCCCLLFVCLFDFLFLLICLLVCFYFLLVCFKWDNWQVSCLFVFSFKWDDWQVSWLVVCLLVFFLVCLLASNEMTDR